MDDLISRQAAIDATKKHYRAHDNDLLELIAFDIERLPSAEPKRGKWNRLDMDTFNCNQCGTTFVLNQGSEKMHFCPNCGAKMEVNRMDDLISRAEAIDALKRKQDDGKGDLSRFYNTIIQHDTEAIMQLPPIQPKRGKWIEADVCGDTTSWECSCCHNWTGLPTGWNVKAKLWFCPKCTADMREVTE